jgi:histone-lysine N-methyltransferase SETD3
LRSRVELDAPKHIFLMIFMLVDRRNPNSFFKPYYDILPETLNNMPIFWQPHELKYLTGSYLLEQIDERNVAIEEDYLAICNIAPEFRSICNLQEFKWSRMCVCSRNFGLVINGIQTAAMVPYADMLNHYRPRETKWQFDDQRQGFTVVTLQPIAAGAQVYDSYGRKCNHRFLLNYGFSVENNVETDGFCPNEVSFVVVDQSVGCCVV